MRKENLAEVVNNKQGNEKEKVDVPKYNPYGMNPLFALDLRILKSRMAPKTSVIVAKCVREAMRQLPRDNLYETFCYEIYRNIHRHFHLMGPWVVLVGTKFFAIPIKNYSGAIHFQLGPELQIFLYFVVDRDVKLPEYGRAQLKAVEKPEKNTGPQANSSFFGYEPNNTLKKERVMIRVNNVKPPEEYLKPAPKPTIDSKTPMKILKTAHERVHKKRTKNKAQLESENTVDKRIRAKKVSDERRWTEAVQNREMLREQEKKARNERKTKKEKKKRERKSSLIDPESSEKNRHDDHEKQKKTKK